MTKLNLTNSEMESFIEQAAFSPLVARGVIAILDDLLDKREQERIREAEEAAEFRRWEQNGEH